MPVARIDFAAGQQSSLEQLGGAMPQAVNVLFDDAGTVSLRPGISAWEDFGASPLLDAATDVEGMIPYRNYLVYVTSDRKIHAQLSPGLGVDLSDGTAATQLDGSTRPVFAAARSRLVIAGSGLLQKWDGAAALTARLGGSPPAASHVAAISQRLVVNTLGNTGQIQWSEPGEVTGHETWPGLNFAELEARPDPLPALYENTNELIGLGTQTVQMMSPDPGFIFSPARTWGEGCGAPYSFVQADEKFAFMDAKRRIIYSNGRSFEPISDPALTATLAALGRVDDCWGFRMQSNAWNLFVWVFPTDGRTFCWDVDSKKWCEWRGFAAGRWTGFAARSHVYWPDKNLHLVGLADGTIGRFDFTATTDNGAPVRAEVTTGFQDRGTMNWKHCQALKLRFKRGLGAVGRNPPPACEISWRDDLGAFQTPWTLNLGNADDPAPVVEIRTLGRYRQRQWRLTMSADVPLTLSAVEEQFEILEA